MQRVPEKDRIGTNSGNPRPSAVRLFCPHCGERSAFPIKSWNTAALHVTLAVSRCPACMKPVRFIGMAPAVEQITGKTGFDLYVHPAPKHHRVPLEGIGEIERLGPTSARIERAYQGAIEAYNHRLWSSAAVQCGRALEGIAKALVPEGQRGQMLGGLLASLAEHVDLAEPIKRLAGALKDGRNFGAHFDQKVDTDQETADLLCELLDELISYLLLLPERIDDLQERLSSEA